MPRGAVRAILRTMKRFALTDFPLLSAKLRRPFQEAYYAMYSSLYDGIVTDPTLMLIPVDDHMVHRGDGVFETVKTVNGRIYNLSAHLTRLEESARGLGLSLPVTRAQLQDILVEAVRVAGRRENVIRIFVSRGPGGFSVNPDECPQSQLYVVVTAAPVPFMELHPEGARLRTSAIPAKPVPLATFKHCNYVPNVLMKREAAAAGVDFTVGFDEQGFLTEAATENVGIVTADARLRFPRLERILSGTTMRRVMALAKELVRTGELTAVEHNDIARPDMLKAREILLAGTTLHVAAGVQFDGVVIGDGRPGPIYARLRALLEHDMRTNSALLTPALE